MKKPCSDPQSPNLGGLCNIPNTITCCNLISGCIATYYAFQGDFQLSLLFIVIGAVFDFFDGMVARLLHVSSPIGKELDSLADDITFGFAPSAIVFSYLCTFHIHIPFIPFLAFIMAAFSALRLAKFNLDERQALGFIGLPTPANALFWGSLITGLDNGMATANSTLIALQSSLPYLILLGIAISCILLIAEIPMFALKFKHWGWKGNEIKYIFILSCIPLLLLLGVSGFAAIIAWYVILSIATNKQNKKQSTSC
jgi:CDP-diacylglycerol--serine O-phosphatidyltransferase